MTAMLHRTDTELKTAIIDELAWTAGVNEDRLGVAVTDGAVTLSGEVESYPEKLMAERAASGVRGVRAFADEIAVRSSWAGVNDTDIAREAAKALEQAVDIPDQTVVASVHDHTISLSGQVHWNYQRQAAERAVRYLKGVSNVVNQVTLRPTVSTSGVQLAITAALIRQARFDGRHVTVVADPAGAVTLDGTVHSWIERQAVEQAAWSSLGVTSVTNRVRIQD